MLELYANIKKYRIDKKMSQQELADKTGYTDRSSIAKIEKGEVDLPQSKIMAIARALGVDAGILMGNDGVSPSPSSLTRSEETLIGDYRKLNDTGKAEAKKRVHELTQIKEYTQDGDAKKDVRSFAS